MASCTLLAVSGSGAFAQTDAEGTASPTQEAQGPRPENARSAAAEEQKPKAAASPWILLPTFSNSPKLGTSVGGMAAYMTQFDPQSQVSILGANVQYTSTNSATVSLFARTSFGGDRHRLSLGAVGGLIKNDYDDYLGSGQPLKSEDHIGAVFVRYLYRVRDDWFLGAQALSTNYQIVGQTSLDDEMLAFLGLSGFKSGGAGLVVQHDSRDRQDSPRQGWMLNFNNVAYRQSADFDVLPPGLSAILEPRRGQRLRGSSEQPVD